jgi:hypothetical protein
MSLFCGAVVGFESLCARPAPPFSAAFRKRFQELPERLRSDLAVREADKTRYVCTCNKSAQAMKSGSMKLKMLPCADNRAPFSIMGGRAPMRAPLCGQMSMLHIYASYRAMMAVRWRISWSTPTRVGQSARWRWIHALVEALANALSWFASSCPLAGV